MPLHPDDKRPLSSRNLGLSQRPFLRFYLCTFLEELEEARWKV